MRSERSLNFTFLYSSVLNGIHDEMTALMKFVDNEQPAVNGDGALNGHVEEKFEQTDDGSVWKEVGAKHKTMPTRSVSFSYCF